MKVRPTAIPEVLAIEPRLHSDARGAFFESWQETRFARAGVDHRFVQDNQSISRRGTLRGLHYQLEKPQGKLVWVAWGEIFDVAVDLRRSSSSFGRHVATRLTAERPTLLWIPPGFAHGIYALSERAVLLYKCTDYYAADAERTIRWDDPDLAIDWPLTPGRSPILSERDSRGAAFREAELFR